MDRRESPKLMSIDITPFAVATSWAGTPTERELADVGAAVEAWRFFALPALFWWIRLEVALRRLARAAWRRLARG